MEESIKTLKNMLEDCEKRAINCDRIIELLDPEMNLWESSSGHNIYVVRMVVDHISEKRTLEKEISALRIAIEHVEKDVLE